MACFIIPFKVKYSKTRMQGGEFMDKGKHNHKSVYTFMMIPNDEDKLKTFRFPKWILRTITLILASILVISTYFIYSFINIKIEYAKKTKDIETLEVVNDKQKKQISELQAYTQNISEKINNLSKLENEVKDLVGLSTDEDDTENEEASILYSQNNKDTEEQTSRGGIYSRNIDSSQQYDQGNILMQIKNDLDKIDENISKEEDNFHTLKLDVTDQLNYLAARPTGWPNNGRITSPFGSRRAPRWGASTFHTGIDIANTYGSSIRAAGNGRVISAGWKGGLGYTVLISHGHGFTTLYGHNSSIKVEVGQQVERGQVIAKLGNSGNSTGPHVHFEIHVNGNPVDPMKFLGK
jgi:murein DD-endopeptidase MepM/ murein hydrolase activator NlpD